MKELTKNSPFDIFGIVRIPEGASSALANQREEGGVSCRAVAPAVARRREASGRLPFGPLTQLRAFYISAPCQKLKRRIIMNISVPEVRPDQTEIISNLDKIDAVKQKLSPVLTLLVYTSMLKPTVGEVLAHEELGNLGWLLRDMLAEVWTASENIYELCKEVAA